VRGYLYNARNSIMASMTYRIGFLFSLMSNLVIVTITYFLWKAIYSGRTTIHGMIFNDAFATVVISMTLYQLFLTYTQHGMNSDMRDGNISQILIKPVDYQIYLLSDAVGRLFLNLLTVTVPTLLLIVFVFRVTIPIGMNILFFFFSILISYLINYLIEFIVGTISFYTLSVWGISAAFGVLVSIMSGAVVPLGFFPAWLRQAAEALPFRAIFAIPMNLLLTENPRLDFFLQGFGIQLFWLLFILLFSRFFFKRALKIVTVQGG